LASVFDTNWVIKSEIKMVSTNYVSKSKELPKQDEKDLVSKVKKLMAYMLDEDEENN